MKREMDDLSIHKEASYVIGVDYGSLSCRGILADVRDGHIVAEAEFSYPHGILTDVLPNGTPLRGSWCLQHPADYLAALDHIIPKLQERSGVSAEQIIGIGVDFTASTVVPLDSHFRPLCESYPERPHAWPKLWKHHGAQLQAEKLTRLCKTYEPDYLRRYGGKISSECLFSKVLQVFEEDPEIFQLTHSFVEAMDYLTSLLCDATVFSGSVAAAKAFYSRETGYPDSNFFAALHPALKKLPREKLMTRFENFNLAYPGEIAGRLCPQMTERFGLCPGIAVSAAAMGESGTTPTRF